MDVIVRSRNLEIPDRLRMVAKRKLAKLDRFTHDTWRVEVDFSETRNPRVTDRCVCAVTMHLRRQRVTAHAASRAPEAALDLVVEKLEQQIARIKDQRVPRSTSRR